MHISNLKLWNFRKFGTEEEFKPDSPSLNLNFTKGLNVIIGENDSGKSAIIDAIKLVLKTHSYEFIKVDPDDFYDNSSHFKIEIRFDNLLPNEAKNFTEWLGWEGTGENAEPYLKVILDVLRQEDRILPYDVKAGVDDEGYLLTAGAREYLKATYLKPLRDAENELTAKKNSRLSQILLGDPAFKGNKGLNHELVFIYNKLKQDLEKYFKGEFEIRPENEVEGQISRPQEGKEIKDRIDGYIQSFYGKEYATEFEASSNDIKSILEKLTLNLKDELNPGLGTLNRLSMAAELLHLEKQNWSGIRLGLIEELEAHLHPQAQMQVIETLQELDSIQLILTTHSPNLASKVKLENLIICNGDSVFPMGSTYTQLAPDQYRFLEIFLDTTKANLFFAKGVILVEGWAEEILIPSIANHIGINLTEKGVSIVNIGNLALQKYANIFLRKELPDMNTPVAVVTDSDVREYEIQKLANGDTKVVKRDAVIIETETRDRLSNLEMKSDKNVQYFIAPTWTFEYALCKSASLANLFKQAAKFSHNGTDWEQDFEQSLAEKLIKRTLNKTEIAYWIANKLDDEYEESEKAKKEGKDAHLATIINKEDKSESIYYIINAIRYAAGDNNN